MTDEGRILNIVQRRVPIPINIDCTFSSMLELLKEIFHKQQEYVKLKKDEEYILYLKEITQLPTMYNTQTFAPESNILIKYAHEIRKIKKLDKCMEVSVKLASTNKPELEWQVAEIF